MNTVQESDQVVQRRANLEELRKLGVDPYPHRFEVSATVEAIVGEHGARTHDDLEAAQIRTRTAGRILAIPSRPGNRTAFRVLTWRTSSTPTAVPSFPWAQSAGEARSPRTTIPIPCRV